MPAQVTDVVVRAIRQIRAEKGFSTREIGKIFDISSAAVSYWLRVTHLPSFYAKRGSKLSKNRLLSIKKRRTKVARLATATIKRNRFVVPKFESANAIRIELARQGDRVSKRTVIRDLRALGFVSRTRPRVPNVSEEHFKRRRAWCRRHRALQARDVVFSDEKYFAATGCGSRQQWVHRSRQDLDRLPIEKAGYPDKLMVWGAIGVGYRLLVLAKGTSSRVPGVYSFNAQGAKKFHRRSDESRFNITADWYKRNCLRPLIPYLKRHNKIFMQDGAGIHTAQTTLNYLKSKGVNVLDWPARSPDLNPIERLWAILAKRVAARYPRTIDDIAAAVIAEFNAVPQATIDRLVLSHDERRRKVERLNGAW